MDTNQKTKDRFVGIRKKARGEVWARNAQLHRLHTKALEIANIEIASLRYVQGMSLYPF